MVGVGAVSVLVLLLAEGAEDKAHDLLPFAVGEDAFVARLLPVGVGQAQAVAGGVELPTAFVDLAVLGAVAEGVGVGVDEDALELAEDDAADHLPQLVVFTGVRQVGPDLRGGVAEPHGVDVAGVDEGVVVAVDGAEMDGRVERVGEAVFKHPRQLLVRERAFDAHDFFLYGFRGKEPLGEGGAERLRVIRVGVDGGIVARHDEVGAGRCVTEEEGGRCGCGKA